MASERYRSHETVHEQLKGYRGYWIKECDVTPLERRVKQLEGHLTAMPSQLMAYKADVKALHAEIQRLMDALVNAQAELARLTADPEILVRHQAAEAQRKLEETQEG